MYNFLRTLTTFVLALPLIGWANAQSPASESENLLAQGPLEVIVRRTAPRSGEKVVKGSLFRLTTKRLIYYPENASRPDVVQPGKDDRVQVESHDPKLTWDFDSAKGTFTGKALTPKPIDIKPVAFDRETESRYLFFVLEQLQERTDNAIKLDDAQALKTCVQRAAELAAHAQKRKLHTELIKEFETLAPYVKAQQDVFQRRRELFQKSYKKAGELVRAEAETQARHSAVAAMGLLQAFASSIPTTEFYSLDRDSDLVVAHQSVNLSGVVSGLGTMMQSQLSYAQEQSRLNAAKKALAEKAVEEYQNLKKELDDRRKDRAEVLRELGSKNYQLPTTNLVEQQKEVAELLRKTKDYTTLVDLLTLRAKEVRGKALNDNPFLLVEINTLKSKKSQADIKKHVQETFVLAEQCVAAAKLVPEGAVYDCHRREILLAAADLAVQAATLEVGNQPSAEAYNFKALYGVRLLDLVSTFGKVDIGGDLRELRARVLLQVGQKEEALQQAVEIEELRKPHSTFHYHLARMYCANNKSKEGFRCLEDAIKGGFHDIRAVRFSGDLVPLRTDKRFANLTRVIAESKVTFPKPKGVLKKSTTEGNDVEVTNRSLFALTNVRFRLEVQVAGRTQTYQHVFDAPILPNETYKWTNAFAVELKQRPQAVLIIESDQGTVKVLPTAR